MPFMFKFVFRKIPEFLLVIIHLNTCGYSQQLTKGPFLVEPGSNSMIIRWETDQQIPTILKYGIVDTLIMEENAVIRGNKSGGYLYEVFLDHLIPGNEYSYQVKNDSFESELQKFKTHSENQQTIRFIAIGDSRSNPEIFKKIASDIRAENPDFIINMGDIVENGGDNDQWNDYYFSVAKDLISKIPLISTLGDHEGDGDDGELFRHYLRIDQSTQKQWFSFDYGNAHFISLDYRHPDSKEMIDWYIQDITSSKAQWNFVYVHRPCYNLGGHRSTWGRESWPDLFSKYKIDIVFAGHSHIYERFYPIRSLKQPDVGPVVYITTGGAGAELYDAKQSTFLAVAESVNHYVSIELSGDTLTAQTIRNDGSLLDKFSIIKVNDYQDEKYISSMRIKEELDNLTMFTRALSTSIEPIPLSYYAGELNIELTSSSNVSIPFTFKLNKESSNSYEMKQFSGMLESNENKKVPIKIYSKTDITISPWGEIKPELILEAIYTDQFGKKIVEGSTIGYWPNDDNY